MTLIKKMKNIDYIDILDKIFIFGLYLYALGSHSSKSAISFGIGLVVLMWWLKLIFVRNYEYKKPVKYWPFLVLIGVFIFSRNDIGFIIESRTTSKIILGIFFFLALINEVRKKETIERLLLITITVLTISSFYANYQYLFAGVRRAYGLARFSITAANVGVMGVGVILPLLFRKHNKTWQYLLLGLAFAVNTSAILFSLTRGSYFAWLVVIAVFAFIRFPKVLPIFLIVILLTYSFLPANIQDRFLSSFDEQEKSYVTRVAMWETSVEIMLNRPLRGIGLDNFPANLPEEFNDPDFKTTHRHAHNNYFHFGAEAGIPAFLLLLYISFILLKKMYRGFLQENHQGIMSKKNIYLSIFLGLLGFLATGLTVANFIDFQSNHYFWFLAGIGLALLHINDNKDSEEL